MENDFFYSRFPPALSDSEITKLFESYHLKDDSSFDKIVAHNARLVVYIINKNFYSTSFSFDDLFSVGIYGLIKAVKSFDEKKGIKFATYASKVIINEILMLIRKEKKHEQVSSYNVKISDENDYELIDLFASEENIELLYLDKELKSLIGNILSEENDIKNSYLTINEKTILNYSFGINGYPQKNQKEVAEILNISQSYVSRILNRAVLKIRNEIAKYGYVINQKKMPRNIEISIQSLYEMFPENTKKEVDDAVDSELSEMEKNILLARFGGNLEKPQEPENWENNYYNNYLNVILPKLNKKLTSLKKQSHSWQSIKGTIYDVLKPYSKKDIDLAIIHLEESEKEFLKRYYGDDFNIPKSLPINLEPSEKDLLKIITKKIVEIIKTKVKNEKLKEISEKKEKAKPVEKIKPKSLAKKLKKPAKIPQESYQKDEQKNQEDACLINLTIDKTFIELLKKGSWQEIIVLSLKFGLASTKEYSVLEISMLLDLNPVYVQNVIHNFLIRYQSQINNSLNEIISDIEFSRKIKK